LHKFTVFGVFLALVLIGTTLTCGLFIDGRTFSWEAAHTPSETTLEESSYLVARNYKQLLDRAQSLLLAGETSGNIRFYGTSETLSADLNRACTELTLGTPIGAYAVDSITMTPTQMFSYQSIAVSVVYRRELSEIASLRVLESSSDLPGILHTALSSNAPTIALSMDYYSPELLNFEQNLSDTCATFPDVCYGLSGYEISTFPSEGLSRIVEIRFSYDTSAEESARRRKLASDKIAAIVSEIETEDPQAAYRAFFNRIRSTAHTAERTSSTDDTPYGVLLEGRGTAFGMSATFYQLCRAESLPCYIVIGTKNGAAHAWNLVFLENSWYHIDLTGEDPDGTILLTGAEMQGYAWKNPDFRH